MHGYDLKLWETAKEQALEVLAGCARKRANQTISYSELANSIHAIRFDPHDHAFHLLLGKISEDENDLGRGMLSVLVVYKGQDQMPGPGFFELAKSLGRDVSDKLKFWSEEFQLVLDSHKTP